MGQAPDPTRIYGPVDVQNLLGWHADLRGDIRPPANAVGTPIAAKDPRALAELRGLREAAQKLGTKDMNATTWKGKHGQQLRELLEEAEAIMQQLPEVPERDG